MTIEKRCEKIVSAWNEKHTVPLLARGAQSDGGNRVEYGFDVLVFGKCIGHFSLSEGQMSFGSPAWLTNIVDAVVRRYAKFVTGTGLEARPGNMRIIVSSGEDNRPVHDLYVIPSVTHRLVFAGGPAWRVDVTRHGDGALMLTFFASPEPEKALKPQRAIGRTFYDKSGKKSKIDHR